MLGRVSETQHPNGHGGRFEQALEMSDVLSITITAPATNPNLSFSKEDAMSTTELRREIKNDVDRLSPGRLASLADYVDLLSLPPLAWRVKAAEKAIATGKGANRRKVSSDY